MNILLNTDGHNGKFQPGTYSRPYRLGSQQFRLYIAFNENGTISLNHEEVITTGRSNIIKFKVFGQIIRIHEEGESNMLAYYSFFYSEKLLHLCALSDDNISRKLVLNGSWRSDSEMVRPSEPPNETLSVQV